MTVRFVGEAKQVVGFETLETELQVVNPTVSQVLSRLIEDHRAKINTLMEGVREGRYVILLDGVSVSSLKGLETPVTDESNVTIVHAVVGG